jgi:1,4-alpha-glucan branching enzyme
MKKLLLLVILICGFSYSQIITWQPYFVKDSDSIDVYFDATQGNQGLLNYTGDVYAHTGVLTNLSLTTGSWRYVLTTWGVNTPQTKLDRVGANLYHFRISPSVRSFYNVPVSEQISNVCFVFRSSDATRQGKTASGGDIFLPLFGSGLNVAITSPAHSLGFSDFKNIGDTIKISAVSSHSTSLALYAGTLQLGQTTTDSSINFNYIVPSAGKVWIKAIATGSLGSAVDSFYYVVNSPVPILAVPSGVVDGINYSSNTSVTLSLYAPLKKNIYVIGDFNNWQIDPAYAMNVTSDSVHWWITINGLTAQKEYVFQYLVDGNLRIADPYSEKILDPANDQYISSSTYPNLIPYPVGKTTEIASVIQTAQTSYPWQVTNFQKPAKQDLVVYELLIRDFLATHDYKTLKDTLNYLKNLGVNAIELMPVAEFEGNISWGYNPSFHMALDKYYGPKNDLKAFIDKAHSMGIAVILDVVFNHVMGSSPLARLYWDAANNRPAANNPWLNPIPKHDYNVGNDINHESLATQYYLDRITGWWVSQFNIDGFRFDLAKGFTQTNTLGNTALWGQYDQSRVNIIERMGNKIWALSPSAYLILEYFADNSEETVLSNFGFMLWGNENNNYLQSAMGYPTSADVSWGYYKARGWNNPTLVTYMESHDEERMMFKNLAYGNASGTYNVKDLHTALNRVKLASAFFYTIPGPKMLWEFGELGYDFSNTNYNRVDPMPIRWDYNSDPYRKDVYKVIAALTKLKTYSAFDTVMTSYDLIGLWKRINIIHPSMNVTVIGNFNVVTASGNPNFIVPGKWYDYFTGDSITVLNPTDQISLAPGEWHIYTSVKLPTPEVGIVEDVKDNSSQRVTGFDLLQNYPNPFNPSTQIKYQVLTNSNVVIKIYDILGNEVKTLVNESRPQGNYTVTWNGDNNSGKKITSGVYFYRMEAGSFVKTMKLLLLK